MARKCAIIVIAFLIITAPLCIWAAYRFTADSELCLAIGFVAFMLFPFLSLLAESP